MPPFFPHVTGTFKLEEPPALRRFSMSIVEMALVTGVVLRLFWALAILTGPNDSLVFAGGVFALRLILLFGMAALHLGNYTLNRNRRNKRWNSFISHWNQQHQNLDNSPVNLQQAIAELKLALASDRN